MSSRGGAGVVSCTVLLAVALCASARSGDGDFRTEELQGVGRKLLDGGGNSRNSAKAGLGLAALDGYSFLGAGGSNNGAAHAGVVRTSRKLLEGVIRKLLDSGGGGIDVSALNGDGIAGGKGGTDNGAGSNGVAASGNSAKGGVGVSVLNGDGIAGGTGGNDNGAANGGTAGRKLLGGASRKLLDGNSGKSANGGVGVSILKGDGIQGVGSSNNGAGNGANIGNRRR